MEKDPFNLERFMAAQSGLYGTTLAEIRAGRKRSHWMWFVFPQLGGLGHSPMAQRYAISGLDEPGPIWRTPRSVPDCARSARLSTRWRRRMRSGCSVRSTR
jgi:hypothetical protein